MVKSEQSTKDVKHNSDRLEKVEDKCVQFEGNILGINQKCEENQKDLNDLSVGRETLSKKLQQLDDNTRSEMRRTSQLAEKNTQQLVSQMQATD